MKIVTMLTKNPFNPSTLQDIQINRRAVKQEFCDGVYKPSVTTFLDHLLFP